MRGSELVDIFQKAKKDRVLAIIEGVQALKHAVRFEAKILHIVTCDINTLKQLMDDLAPDISHMVSSQIIEMDEKTFRRLSPKNHRTKVVSLAKRKLQRLDDIASDKPIVFLEDPKDLENIGAVIRVAAAADAASVMTDALVDIWHPGIIRGAAGLQYALPTLNCSLEKVRSTFPGRKLISLDPNGKAITGAQLPHDAILVFGTERSGIKESTLEKSDDVFRLPMKQGVSSLNLATSVAATLYQM